MSMLLLLFGTGLPVNRRGTTGSSIIGGTFSRGRWHDDSLWQTALHAFGAPF